jgi:hypothetical protein
MEEASATSVHEIRMIRSKERVHARGAGFPWLGSREMSSPAVDDQLSV